MLSSRRKTALTTALLTVLALVVTVPFETEIFTDVTSVTRIAYR